jgi:hypothetical protein
MLPYQQAEYPFVHFCSYFALPLFFVCSHYSTLACHHLLLHTLLVASRVRAHVCAHVCLCAPAQSIPDHDRYLTIVLLANGS